MAVSISMNIVQNSQSIENNISNVTVEVYAHWTRGSYNAQTAPDGYPDARGTVSIDNVQYTFYSKFNTGHTTSGSERIFTKTLNVAHNNEGEKILSCWASYATGVSSGTVSTSGSLALTAIPRKSVLRAADGILGTAQNLKVERKSTQLTHTITYSCGNESDTICAKTASESLSWTPPLELAAQYPNSTSVPVVLTITTYHADNEVGVSSVTITCAIPESVVPTVTVEVSDYSNHLSKYGAYVQGKSKLRIVANATGAQGSTVKSHKTEVDGKSYSKASVTTEVLTGTGNLIVTTTVTDSRGRTATASVTVPVLAYTAPSISEFSVSRCDAGGNASKSGAYLAVRFKAAITALNGKNSAVYTVQYKKTGISYYTIQTLGEYGGKHAISNGVFVFPAETAYSYDVILTAKDDFTSIPQSGVGSSIKKTWSIFKEGLGFAFGKIAEKANTLDMGWDIELNQNDVLRNGAVAYAPAGHGLGGCSKKLVGGSLDDVRGNGWYGWENETNAPSNIPFTWGYMEVCSAHYEESCVQIAYSIVELKCVIRHYSNGTWGEWEWVNPPMVPGIEYRTAERWNGKIVYASLTKISGLPNTSWGSYNLAANYCDNMIRYHIAYERSDGATFLDLPEAGNIYLGSYGTPYVVFNTTSNLSTMTAYVTLYYTKTN